MKLSNHFIRKRVNALRDTNLQQPHELCPLSEARQILVLFESSDYESVRIGLEVLRQKGKQVTSAIYVSTSDKEQEREEASFFLSAQKDTNIWNIPFAAKVEEFMTHSADILIDLTHPDNYPMQFLMLQHPCRFKVGIKQNNLELYDLSIAVTTREDIKQLFEHILFYLEAIRSK